MRKIRANPDRAAELSAYRRAHYHRKGKHTERAYYAKIKATDPWGWRIRNLRRNTNPDITLEWLRSLWNDQGGRCALSGRSLDIRTAELDHILPKSRGGSDDLDNLRLTVPEANACKGGNTDEELFSLCHDILAARPELIGNAILAAEHAAQRGSEAMAISTATAVPSGDVPPC